MYDESEARDERGQWTTGPGSLVAHAPGDDHTAEAIQRAVAERPSRLSHGHTVNNAFWVTPDGRVVQYNQLPWPPPEPLNGYANVHSHLGEGGAAQSENKLEGTFSGGDVETFAKQGRYGLRKMVVITSSTKMDVLESVPGETDPKFLKLGRAGIEKELGQGGSLEARKANYAESTAWYQGLSPARKAELAATNTNVSGEYHREKMRGLASKYGLRYREGVTWRTAGAAGASAPGKRPGG